MNHQKAPSQFGPALGDATVGVPRDLELFKNLEASRTLIAQEGETALKRLYGIAMRDTGQAKIVAKFLAGLYNGYRFPFDLNDFRAVDEAIFEDCMALLRMDARQCKQEVHTYFENGSQKWEQMIRDWSLDPRC